MQSNGVDDYTRKSDHTISRLASIGQISAGIAHEVRNPLTAVKGFIQLLQPENPHPYLDVASSELDRAISTLQNLLQVSKPDLDDEPYIPIHLCSEFEALLYLFQDKVYRVQIVRNFRDADQIIYGKRNQIKKAFFNLLKNAFEAIPHTGEVRIEHRRTEDQIHVTIQDTGTGIPEEKLELLGTPFFTTKDEGTGMGLAQVYSALYQHGATIEVWSRVGEGTTFLIKFSLESMKEIKLADLELQDAEGFSLEQFFRVNHNRFDQMLLVDVAQFLDYVKKIKYLSPENFLDIVHRLLFATLTQQREDAWSLAAERGANAAKHGVPLALVIDFFLAYRKLVWDFLYTYFRHRRLGKEEFFRLEKEINHFTDLFIQQYLVQYVDAQNKLMREQREMLEELAVTLIPLTSSVAVLPLAGTVDTYRAKKIQERVFKKIKDFNLKIVVVDVSGVAYIDKAAVGHVFRIAEGIAILGCKAIVTGIRPEIANIMVDMGISISGQVEIQSTLQKAIEEYGLHKTKA
ncbi:ATP-binding protein [Effusibacillus lacus]|uniref:histidine kinase n=1 Tax=Effusibacillus lacus TaxID=1348429 RepID=A0A292YQK4_9BACL|nr:ATP-binding protein [Effusibacillus lacus]TCS74218.1 rsbT co-antagonist protein RsbR [Effusibacillus lacus]GAX90785.1 sigma-B regulator [Effusibacillus lacus]